MALGLKRLPLARSGRTGETSDDHQRAVLLGRRRFRGARRRRGLDGDTVASARGHQCLVAVPSRSYLESNYARDEYIRALGVTATPLPHGLTLSTGAHGGARAATTMKPALWAGFMRYRYGDSNFASGGCPGRVLALYLRTLPLGAAVDRRAKRSNCRAAVAHWASCCYSWARTWLSSVRISCASILDREAGRPLTPAAAASVELVCRSARGMPGTPACLTSSL
jgi:hypothetical protein